MRIHLKNLTCVGFEEFCFELLRRVGFSNLDRRKGTPKDSSPADSGRDITAHQAVATIFLDKPWAWLPYRPAGRTAADLLPNPSRNPPTNSTIHLPAYYLP